MINCTAFFSSIVEVPAKKLLRRNSSERTRKYLKM